MSQPSPAEQLERIRRGTLDIVRTDELRTRLEQSVSSGRPLRVKLTLEFGNGPVHLGHAVVLRKLRQFQDMGHQPVIVVGSFAALATAPQEPLRAQGPLTVEEIAERSRDTLEQAGRIIDLDRAEVVFNGSWYSRMSLDEFVRACSGLTVDDLLGSRGEDARLDKLRGRLEGLFYPLVAAYDSVVVQADVEIAGADRSDDLHLARTLQARMGRPGQVNVTMPLLCGADGELKMSSVFANAIFLTRLPSDMYGQLMPIPDALLGSYFELLTDIPAHEVDELLADGADLRRAREILAHRVVSEYYNAASADGAAQEFQRALARPGVPDDVPTHVVSPALLTDGRFRIVELLVRCGLAANDTDARRSVSQGRTYVDGRRVTDADGNLPLKSGCMIQVGSRRFARVLIK